VETLVVERPLARPGSLDSRDGSVIRAFRGAGKCAEKAAQKLLRRHPDSRLGPDFDEVARLAREAGDTEISGQIRNQGRNERS
jgi:hypothetical protein